MLSKQELDAALAAERAMYRALSEVQDIPRELLDAVDRQDQVSVRLFLTRLRTDFINPLSGFRAVSSRESVSQERSPFSLRSFLWMSLHRRSTLYRRLKSRSL